MNVIVLDPGQTTGYVIYDDVDSTTHHGECQPDYVWELLTEFYDDAMSFSGSALILYEEFDYRRHKMHANLVPVEVIGVIKEFARQHPDIIINTQKPAQAVGPEAFWNNDRLKQQGMYYSSMQHARDAARHYLWWLHFGEGKQYAEIPRKGFKQD